MGAQTRASKDLRENIYKDEKEGGLVVVYPTWLNGSGMVGVTMAWWQLAVHEKEKEEKGGVASCHLGSSTHGQR